MAIFKRELDLIKQVELKELRCSKCNCFLPIQSLNLIFFCKNCKLAFSLFEDRLIEIPVKYTLPRVKLEGPIIFYSFWKVSLKVKFMRMCWEERHLLIDTIKGVVKELKDKIAPVREEKPKEKLLEKKEEEFTCWFPGFWVPDKEFIRLAELFTTKQLDMQFFSGEITPEVILSLEDARIVAEYLFIKQMFNKLGTREYFSHKVTVLEEAIVEIPFYETEDGLRDGLWGELCSF